MNIIYFTMKKLNENKAFLAMLGFLLVFSCSKDKKEGNGNGNGDATKYTLTITKPTNGKLVSKPGNIDCGGEGTVCKAEFDKDTEVTLTATADKGYAPAAWQGACDKTKATESTCKLSIDANKTAGRAFSAVDTDGDEVPDVDDVDDDNDGLIEIHDLDMFNHIQYSLAGTSHKTEASAKDNREGAPEDATDDCTTTTESFYLCGYELARDLNFAEGASYAGGSVNTDWRPDDSDTDSATNEGFSGASNFAGIFEGNGYSISNLYSRSGGENVGLFRSITSAASIRNLGVVDANIYSGGSVLQYIGALVSTNNGTIIASSATGGTLNSLAVDGIVGGLVGYNVGSIVSSYATVAVNGGARADYVGGLVGSMGNSGTITASYATGAVNGGAGIDYAGGLVGAMGVLDPGSTNSIIASYATGAVNGGEGTDYAGGLVGIMHQGTNSITACYATGDANGDAGSDHVGALVGQFSFGTQTITHSYGFGSGTKEGSGNDGTAHPAGLTGSGAAKANGLTAPGGGTTSAAAEWGQVASKTEGAWDFGTASQAPALQYADYDGSGGTDYCDLFPDNIPGTDTDLVCGTANASLLPGQGR